MMRTNDKRERGIADLLPWVKEGVEIEDLKTAPARQERVGVESGQELALMHLANSTPTLSLCMTGRGESKGNEGEKR